MANTEEIPRLARQAYEKAEAAGKLDMKNETEVFEFLETLPEDEKEALLLFHAHRAE